MSKSKQNQEYQGAAASPSECACKTLDNKRRFIDDLRHNGEAWLADYLAPRFSQFVDVGANVGDWSGLILEANPGAHLLLFEPGQEACLPLAARFAGNPSVELVKAAARAVTGALRYYEEPGAGMTSSLVTGVSRPDAVARESTSSRPAGALGSL
jgi:hypothetical protein